MSTHLNHLLLLALALASATPVAAQETDGRAPQPQLLTLEAAIRSAWTRQSQLQAGQAMVEAYFGTSCGVGPSLC